LQENLEQLVSKENLDCLDNKENLEKEDLLEIFKL